MILAIAAGIASTMKPLCDSYVFLIWVRLSQRDELYEVALLA